jgi:hypothetical protein
MSFIGDLFGGAKRKDIEKGRQRATADINQYYDLGRGASEQWYNRAVTFLQPQLDAGNRALEAENAALGLSGPEAQAQFQKNYTTSPGYTQLLDERVKTVTANNAKRGLTLSGAQLRQVADEGQKTLSEDYNKYLDRITRSAERGAQTAAGAASMTQATGKDLALGYFGQGGTLANIDLQSAAATANTRFSIGDLAGLIGAAAKAYVAFA